MKAVKVKAKEIAVPIELPRADLQALKALAKTRKQSVDVLASSIVRRYVRVRLI